MWLLLMLKQTGPPEASLNTPDGPCRPRPLSSRGQHNSTSGCLGGFY